MAELDGDGQDDPVNPLSWPRRRKVFQTCVVSAIALVCTTASSIITPAVKDIQHDINVSAEVSLLPYVLYVLGLGFGPLLAGPISENFGRIWVYLIGMTIFALFILGAGFSNGIASLIVCRFFAGAFGSPGLTIGGATLADIWLPHERAIPWAIYMTTPFLGPAICPLIGGYVTLYGGWRWTEWTLLFFVAVVMTPMASMKETYKPVILRKRALHSKIVMEAPQRNHKEAAQAFATKILSRPVHMAFVEPVVGFFSLYIALNFGMVYASFAAFPQVFANAYAFGIGATELTFLGLGVGCLIACIIMIIHSRITQRRRAARSKESGATITPSPEE